MISVVIPYLQETSQGDELRYALRSWSKFFKDDFNIVLVGDKPVWYVGDYIKTISIRGKSFTRALDITLKLNVIIASKGITDEFIYSYDDVYLLSDCTVKDFQQTIAIETMPANYKMPRASGKWKRLLEVTFKSLNLDVVYNYETHLPRMFKKEWLNMIIQAYRLDKNPMLVSTLYYNEFFDKPDLILSQNNEFKAGIYDRINYVRLQQMIRGKKVLNHSENAYNDAMKRLLRELYKEKSKFEA